MNIMFYIDCCLIQLIFCHEVSETCFTVCLQTFWLNSQLNEYTFTCMHSMVAQLMERCSFLDRLKCIQITLAILKFSKTKHAVWIVLLQTKLCYPDPTGTRYMMLVYAMSLCNLKLISLGIDTIEEFERRDHLESFYRVIAYTLYFPVFFCGPFISYKTFINKVLLVKHFLCLL